MKLTETRIKQIIKEEIQNVEESIDPMILAMGGVTLYALYKFIFKSEPDTEEDLQKVRQYVDQLEAEVDSFKKPPPASPDSEELIRQARIKKLRKQYGKEQY